MSLTVSKKNQTPTLGSVHQCERLIAISETLFK